MSRSDMPGAGDLPTLRQLNRATALSVAAAAVILVTTVLPAEYGVDPTGFGRLTGLTAMGEAKRAGATASAPVATSTTTRPGGPTEIRITLQPDQGKEAKAWMKAGEEFAYRWSTDGAAVSFELHGEPAGATGDEYSSYEKGVSAGADGTFRAPFDGTHGWYWRNRTDKPVTITVSATGQFERFAPL